MSRETVKKILACPRSVDKFKLSTSVKVGYEYLPRHKKWKELKSRV